MFSVTSYPYQNSYYSRKGQVIRRKNLSNPVILTNDQIEQAKEVLLSQGAVINPPLDPSQPYPNIVYSFWTALVSSPNEQTERPMSAFQQTRSLTNTASGRTEYSVYILYHKNGYMYFYAFYQPFGITCTITAQNDFIYFRTTDYGNRSIMFLVNPYNDVITDFQTTTISSNIDLDNTAAPYRTPEYNVL